MSALASLRVPIDAFFEDGMVNDPDPAVRAFRLGLLAGFRGAVHSVADFSKIGGQFFQRSRKRDWNHEGYPLDLDFRPRFHTGFHSHVAGLSLSFGWFRLVAL